MKILNNIILIVSLVFSFVLEAQTDQCDIGNPAGEITVGLSCVTQPFNTNASTPYWDAAGGFCSSSNVNDKWVWFTATSTVTRITYNSTDDAVLHLFGSVCAPNMTNLACADNTSTGDETINYATVIGVTYSIRIQRWGTSDPMFGTICVYTPAYAPNSGCANSDPFCTGTTTSFETIINIGNAELGPEYGCLCAQPNPTWYYLEIGTAGDININIASSCGDVDFAAWGPFSNTTCSNSDLTTTGPVCANPPYYNSPQGNMVDCSYDLAATEDCFIPNAQVGDYYMVMVTNYDNCLGNISFSQTSGTGATDCSVLPIELLSFNSSIEDLAVVLSWKTASEINNDFFTIERSINAIDFKPIRVISGAGNSNSMNSYMFKDDSPLAGSSYYRLKQTDFDGAFTYSNLEAVNFKLANQIQIFPNPSSGVFTIAGEGIQYIKILNVNGQTVYNRDYVAQIDLNGQAKGLYFIEILINNTIIRDKIFIK